MEDDPKEKNVSLAADMQFAEDKITAKSATPLSLVETTATFANKIAASDRWLLRRKGSTRVASRLPSFFLRIKSLLLSDINAILRPE